MRYPEMTSNSMKAFVFDLDGTLIDTETLYVQAVEEILQRWGRRITHERATRIVYGRSCKDVYREIQESFSFSCQEMRQIEKIIQKEVAVLRSSRDICIHSSIALLKNLSTTYPVAVVSGSFRSDVKEGLKLAGITRHVRFFLGGEDYPHGKPDPASYAMAAERLHLPPVACVVFEDSMAGVLSAKAAGMYVVALKRNEAPEQDLSQADEILTNLREFQLSRL